MFTKEIIKSTLLSVMFIIGFSVTSYGKTPVEKMPEFQKYKNLVFKSSELKNYEIKTRENSWRYNTDFYKNDSRTNLLEYVLGTKGKMITKFAVYQEISSTNNNIYLNITYGVFPDTNEAHKAIIFHINSIASLMRAEPKFESKLNQIPDEAYWVSNGSAIIFRIKNICVLIGCSKANNINTQREITIKFANQIIKKIEKIE